MNLRSTSFIVVKPDGIESGADAKLRQVLESLEVRIISESSFYFTNSTIINLWPHRKVKNISAKIMYFLLTRFLSKVLIVEGEYQPYKSLTQKLSAIKGNSVIKSRSINSIRALISAGEKHFNCIHIADSHEEYEREIIIIQNNLACINEFKIKKTNTYKFSIDEASTLIKDRDLSIKVKQILSSKGSLSEKELEQVFFFWSKYNNIYLANYANKMIDLSYY